MGRRVMHKPGKVVITDRDLSERLERFGWSIPSVEVMHNPDDFGYLVRILLVMDASRECALYFAWGFYKNPPSIFRMLRQNAVEFLSSMRRHEKYTPADIEAFERFVAE